MLSQGVLISRFLLGNLKVQSRKYTYLNPLRGINVPRKFYFAILKSKSWWFDAVVTPVPIPNTEVKHCSGDDSPNGAKVASRQDFDFKTGKITERWFFACRYRPRLTDAVHLFCFFGVKTLDKTIKGLALGSPNPKLTCSHPPD